MQGIYYYQTYHLQSIVVYDEVLLGLFTHHHLHGSGIEYHAHG